jgi:hypothetical protein
MKKVVVVMCLLFCSCSSKLISYEFTGATEIRIVDLKETHNGRPLFNVQFNDSTTLYFMYAEEISAGLKTGKWGYNEDIK